MISSVNQSMVRKIFEDGHKPVFKVAKRQHHKTLPVVYPSNKVAGGIIRARLPLMADGLVHMDTNPEIERIAAYPVKLRYTSFDRQRNETQRDFIPDLAVRYRDGRIVFLSYEPVAIQEERPWIAQRTAEVKAHLWETFGCAYCLCDERTIRLQPRFSNLRIMLAHKEKAVDLAALKNVRLALSSARLPATIGELKARIEVAEFGVLSEDGTSTSKLESADLVFTAVMQLAMRGDVKVGLNQPLSMETIVFREVSHVD